MLALQAEKFLRCIKCNTAARATVANAILAARLPSAKQIGEMLDLFQQWSDELTDRVSKIRGQPIGLAI
jgi:hypothetical protein